MLRTALVIVVLLSLASVSLAASKSKKKSVPEDKSKITFDLNSCVDKAIDYRTMMATNPYDNIGKCYWLGFPMVKQQMLSRSVALIGFAGAQQNIFALMDFGKESVPMGMISGLVMGMGAYEYQTVSGSVNTVHHLRKLDGYLKRTKSQQQEKDTRDKKESAEQAIQLEIKEAEYQKAAELAKEEKKKSDEQAQKLRKENERALELERKSLEVQARLQSKRDYQLQLENENLLDQKIKESGLEIKDGVIIDKNSGLMWIRDANVVGTMTLNEADKWVGDFTQAGYSDWKIPTTRELKSISKFGPDILTKAAKNIQVGCYLSTSKTERPSSLFHKDCVDIKNDTTKSYDAYNGPKLNVWPVRGGGVSGWVNNILQ